jgi:hypothetical protein
MSRFKSSVLTSANVYKSSNPFWMSTSAKCSKFNFCRNWCSYIDNSKYFLLYSFDVGVIYRRVYLILFVNSFPDNYPHLYLWEILLVLWFNRGRLLFNVFLFLSDFIKYFMWRLIGWFWMVVLLWIFSLFFSFYI